MKQLKQGRSTVGYYLSYREIMLLVQCLKVKENLRSFVIDDGKERTKKKKKKQSKQKIPQNK